MDLEDKYLSKDLIFHPTNCFKQNPTRELLIKKGMNIPLHCAICQTGLDSATYILRECPFSMNSWLQLGIPFDCYIHLILTLLIGLKQISH